LIILPTLYVWFNQALQKNLTISLSRKGREVQYDGNSARFKNEICDDVAGLHHQSCTMSAF
jgi:hypothetical protein